MSFRLADLKKSVRKGKEGYQVTPARLEGRPAAFRIEFLLQQFEGHLGSPRRTLDPDSLLDFVGDARLGRGLLATLAQWYRMRPRTFAEVLEDGGERLLGHAIAGPVDLRAWLYAAVNRDHHGFLDPDSGPLFWQGQGRALGIRRERLPQLMLLDRPEEAILVRTGPAPSAADVMAAYNARAHTTLLRSATELALRCDAPRSLLERAARVWAGPLDVEWRAEAETLRLFGRPDALGCWTRHGRRVERAALELLALPDLAPCELRGRLTIAEKNCQFVWKADTLALLGAGRGARLQEELPERVTALAATLRRERDRQPAGARRSGLTWSIRQAAHFVGVEGGVCLPNLELRHGDLGLYVRLVASELDDGTTAALDAFHGKTPVVAVGWSGEEACPLTLRFPRAAPQECPAGELLPALADHLERLRETAPSPREARRAMKTAA
jgi:hypothetical protein